MHFLKAATTCYVLRFTLLDYVITVTIDPIQLPKKCAFGDKM
jgi:hypothetical protein